MAQLTLRPAADISVQHSGGGYTMISEVEADDDSTYIYQSVSSTSSRTLQSAFSFTGFTASKKIRITSAALCVRARRTSTASGSSGVVAATIGSVSMSSKSLTSRYTDLSQDLSALLDGWNADLENGVVPTISVTLATAGALGSSKDSSFQIRITQAYLEVEYEEIGGAKEGPAVWRKNKTSGIYEKKAAWKKINGTWQAVNPEDLPVGLYLEAVS